MTRVRAWMAGVWALPVAVAVAFAPTPAAAVEEVAGGTAVLRAGGFAGAPTFIRPPSEKGAPTASFKVTYQGFTPAARAAFQRALDLWARKIRTSVPITVAASYQPLDPGLLGRAGPSKGWKNFAGAPRRNTLYVDALANKHLGRQIDASPDIVAQFSSSFPNWHFGSRAAPAGEYDFTTVVMHEIGHGLGFLGAGRVWRNGNGTVRFASFPTAYDHFTENSAGKALLTDFPQNSPPLAAQLQSNRLFFDSPLVRAANGNRRAKIYAPSPLQPGSSYAHLDETTFKKGSVNSLMTPQLATGETIRDPGPITMALFKSLGW